MPDRRSLHASAPIRRLRSTLSFAVFCAALTPAVGFAGEPSDAQRKSARDLVYQGDRAFEKTDFEAALKAYMAADDIMGVPSTRIEVAKAYVALRRLIAAQATAQSIVDLPAKSSEAAPFVEARKRASALVTELRDRIPILSITVQGARSEVTVSIDGKSVPTSSLASLAVDPGRHVISAAAGDLEGNTDLTVEERSKVTVKVELRAAHPLPPPVAKLPPPSSGTHPLVFIGFIGGGALIGLGAVTGGLSLAATSKTKDACAAHTAECPSEYDKANALGWVSNVSFGVGAGLAGLGVIGLVIGKKSDDRAHAHIAPIVGPTFVGLKGAF